MAPLVAKCWYCGNNDGTKVKRGTVGILSLTYIYLVKLL